MVHLKSTPLDGRYRLPAADILSETTEIAIDEGINVVLPPWTNEPPPPIGNQQSQYADRESQCPRPVAGGRRTADVRMLRDLTKQFINNNGVDHHRLTIRR